MKLCVAIVEVLRKKKNKVNLVYHKKIHGFLNPCPPTLNANVFSLEANFTLFMAKLNVLVLCFPNFKDNFTICP
jgi:hypothetical protein